MRERDRPLAIARDNYRNHLQRRFLKAWIRFNQTSPRSLCALLNRASITNDPKQRWSCLCKERYDQRSFAVSLPFRHPSEIMFVSRSSAGINGWIRAGPWKPDDNLILKFSREYRIRPRGIPHIIVPITDTHYRELLDTCRLRESLAT